MKYYRMGYSDAVRARREVWRRQEVVGVSRTWFRESACGLDASTWTEDIEGEKLFCVVLCDLNILFEAGDQQQVITWLDGLF